MPIDSSKFFDSIRIKPKKLNAKQQALARESSAMCEWPDCKNKGPHRAPKGRTHDKEYWHFCLNHVREYNQSYNFFQGMNADAVARYQKDALTGHRPTWKVGTGKGGMRPDSHTFGTNGDPFGLFSEGMRAEQQSREETTRPVRNAERKALDTLGLEISATPQQVKARFKELVKRHHPDANGGDRSTEDRLIAVIQSYNYLKSVGYV